MNSNDPHLPAASALRDPLRAAATAAGILLLGLLAGAAIEEVRAEGFGDFGGDPTVGTLPISSGNAPDLPGPDQVVYLYGDAPRLRAALDGADAATPNGEGAVAVFELPNGQGWVEFHGEFAVTWADASLLQGLELGLGAGFEGGGLHYAVQTAAGQSGVALLETGRSVAVDPSRLVDAGLLRRPVLVHGLHASGARTLVEFDTQGGAFTVRQQL